MYQILCVKTADNLYGPIAKTKRELSHKEIRRLCRKFRRDDDFAEGSVISASRLGLTDNELKKLPTI